MSNKVRDIIVSVVMIVLGAGMLVFINPLRDVATSDVGPAYVPTLVAVCIIVSAAAKLILSVLDKDPDNNVKHKVFEDNFGGIATILLMAAYVLLLEPVGFIIASIVYLFLQILLLSDNTNRKPVLFAIIAVIIPIAISALFFYVIQVQLPVGIIGF